MNATGPVVVIAVLSLALGGLVWLALRARKAVAVANQTLEALAARTFVAEFEADTVYRMLAKNTLEVGNQHKSFGVVERQDGTIVPFLTTSPLDIIEPGECFAAVRGHMAKLDAGAMRGAANSAEQPSLSPQRMIPRSDVGDKTVLAPVLDVDKTQPHAQGVDAPAAKQPSRNEVEEDLDKTRIVAAKPAPSRAPVDNNAGLVYLKCSAGSDQGSLFHLPFGSASVGRGKDSTASLSDEASSRVHCIIAYERNHFVLRDNGSTNGTYCNDERVAERVLEFGDSIKVANTDLLFTCHGYELQNSDPSAAITAFEASLANQPDFLGALKILAFLLEKDVALQAEAKPLWARIAQIEKAR